MLKKKIIAAVCSAAVLSAVIPARVSQADAGENGDTYLYSTFDHLENKEYANGADLDQQSYVFTNTQGTASCSVVDEPGAGDKSVKLTVTKVLPETEDPQMTPFLKLGVPVDGENIIFETRIKIDADFVGAPNNASSFSFGPTKGGPLSGWWPTKDSIFVRFASDGVYIPVNKTTNTKIGTYERNRWYDIKLFLQKETGRYTVVVAGDGGTAMTGGGMIPNLKEFFPVSEFRTRYDARNNNSCGSVYISHIKVSENRGYELLSSVPADGAGEIDPQDLKVRLNFSDYIDPDTLTDRNISVTAENGLGQQKVPISVAADQKNSCLITFPEGAEYGTKYTLKLEKGVTDLGGLGAKGADSIQFTTKTQPLPPPEVTVDTERVRFYRTTGGMKDITQSGLEPGTVRVSSVVTNQSAQEQTVTLYAGLYETVGGASLEQGDRLVGISKTEVPVSKGSSETVTADIQVPEGDVENKKIVAYWQGSPQLLNALADPVELNSSGRVVRQESIPGVPAAADSEIFINRAELDPKTGFLQISGKTSAGMGRKIFLMAKDSAGKINGMMQTGSKIDGSFAFGYYLGSDTADGVYTISVGAVGAVSPAGQSLEVAVSQAKPVAYDPGIQGECTAGKTVTAFYDYFHPGGKPEGATVIEWFAAPSLDGSYEKINGANGNHYEIAQQYVNQYIRVQITPVTSEGVRGDAVISQSLRVIPAPSAQNVRITGKAQPGEILSGSYEYSHPLKLKEGPSEYVWMRADRANGPYTIIPGANKIAYVVSQDDVGAYLALAVTPVSVDRDLDGKELVIRGKTEQSSGVRIEKMSTGGKGEAGNGETVTVFPGTQTPVFEDIAHHWARYAIEQMAAKNIVEGVSGTRFAPDMEVTRAAFVTMVVRALQAPKKPYADVFEDVKKENWYSGEIQAAYDLGLLSEGTGFRPEEPMLREELCKIIVSAYTSGGGELPEAEPAAYGDYEQISEWAKPYVNQASAAELIQGTEQNQFAPKRAVTRAEAAVLIQRLLNKKEEAALKESAAQREEETADEELRLSYQNAGMVLKALGVLEEDGEETDALQFETLITKGAFVTMMMRAAGVTEETPVPGPAPFQDITEKDGCYLYAASAYSKGLIDGGDAFEPDQYLSLQNAVTMLVKLLGYEQIAAQQGGVMAWAYRKDLTKGLNINSNTPLNLGEASVLVFHALGMEMMQLDAMEGESLTYSNHSGETLAENCLNVCVGEGRVTANDISAVDAAGSPAPEGCIVIEEQELYVGDTQADKYLGYMVCYYAQIDTKTEERTLKAVYLTKRKNTMVEIPSEQVQSFYNMTLSYYDAAGVKTLQKKIPRKASVLYNGVYLGYANDVPEEVFTGKTGSITLLDSQGGQEYDTVIVHAYQTYIVKYVDRTNQIIYDKYDKPPISLKSDGCDVRFQIIKYDLMMDLANLKEDDILLVADSDYYGKEQDAKQKMVEILTSSKRVEGTAVSVSKEEVTIEETRYPLSPDLKTAAQTDLIKSGDKGRFYLDSLGRVAYFDNGGGAGTLRNTAFIIDAFVDEEENFWFRLFNAQGEHLSVKAAKTLRIDGVSYKTNQYAKALELLQTKGIQPENDDGYLVTSSGVNQLIYYELNKEGEIHQIDTEHPPGTQDKSKLIKDVVINDKTLSGGLKYNAYVQTFSGDIMLSNSTVIFGLPQDLNNKDGYGIVRSNALITDKWYKNLTVYNLTEYGMTELVTMPLTAVSNVDGDTSIFVVDQIETALNGNNEAVKQVRGIFEGKEVSYLCEDDTISGELEEVKQGDIIRIALNENNEIKLLEKTMLFDPVRKNPSVSNNYTNQFCLFYGTMTVFDKTTQMAAVLEDGTGLKKYFNLSRARVIVFDREERRVRPGSYDDIVEGMANTGGNLEVVARNRYSETKDIVVLLPERERNES